MQEDVDGKPEDDSALQRAALHHDPCVDLWDDTGAGVFRVVLLGCLDEGLFLLRYRSVCKQWRDMVEQSGDWREQAVAHAARERLLAVGALKMRRAIRRQNNIQRKQWGYYIRDV